MALWVSKLINTLCRPLVKRISAELRPHYEQEIAVLRRSIESAALPLVLKNEIEHMQQLPLIFIREQKELVVIGFASNELSKFFSDSRCMVPPIHDESSLTCDCLTFLDEYHFVTMIRELPTLFSPVRQAIILPFRGDYLSETNLRQILHQLGFSEVFMMDYDRISDSYSICGISHPSPVSSLPIMMCPVADSDVTTRWLVASRYPRQQ